MFLRVLPRVYPDAGYLSWRVMGGSLVSGLTLTDVVIEKAPFLPESLSIEAQTLHVRMRLAPYPAIDAEIRNGRLRLHEGEQAAFRAAYTQGRFDVNVFTPRLGMSSIREKLFPRIPADIDAAVSNVDLYIRGNADSCTITGTFTIAQAARGPIELSNASCSVDLEARPRSERLFGTIDTNGGTLAAANGVRGELGRCRLTFVGPLRDPLLDITGQAFVEDTRISFALTGTPHAPDVALNSRPPYQKDRLLLMLATGRSWKGSDEIAPPGAEPAVTLDMIKDFVDFFLLGGSGSRAAGRLGIKDVSLTFTELEKGVGLSVGLTGRFDARYGIKQTLDESGQTSTTYTLGGQYRLIDKVYVGAQQETVQYPASAVDPALYESQSVSGNRTVYMKFRTEF